MSTVGLYGDRKFVASYDDDKLGSVTVTLSSPHIKRIRPCAILPITIINMPLVFENDAY
jgi:hypothetical protein